MVKALVWHELHHIQMIGGHLSTYVQYLQSVEHISGLISHMIKAQQQS